MIHINENKIEKIYTMKDCLNDVENAFKFYKEGKVEVPVRLSLNHSTNGAATLYMPAYIKEIEYESVKIVSVFPENNKINKPSLQSVILLTETKSGDHLCTMDGSLLTAMRTGAITGLGAKFLSRKDSKNLCVIGCGAQSLYQIKGVLEVREIESITLCNRTLEKAEMLRDKIKTLYKDINVNVESDINKSVNNCDILVCSTSSYTPLFNGNSIKNGTHISAIGAYKSNMRELDLNAINKCDKVYVDTFEGALHEAGDLLIAQSEGWDIKKIRGELGDIIFNKCPLRENEEEVTLLKSVGVAFLDTVCASSIYNKIMN